MRGEKGIYEPKVRRWRRMRAVVVAVGGAGAEVWIKAMVETKNGRKKSRHVKWNYASFINDGDTNKYEFIHTISFSTDVKYKAFRQILGVCHIASIYVYDSTKNTAFSRFFFLLRYLQLPPKYLIHVYGHTYTQMHVHGDVVDRRYDIFHGCVFSETEGARLRENVGMSCIYMYCMCVCVCVSLSLF